MHRDREGVQRESRLRAAPGRGLRGGPASRHWCTPRALESTRMGL